ncbi:MAG TPA: hypothetical protein VIY73_27115 [Polyangiaceae bacterium]|jgi:hypothetical protein
MKIRNRSIRAGADGNVIAGIDQEFHSLPYILVGGKEFTPTSLKAFIQRRIDAEEKVRAARAAWIAASADYERVHAEVSVVVADTKQAAMCAFGRDSPRLSSFGFTPPKKPAMTDEQKLTAVEKRRATRIARGTKGPKAKLAIKGGYPPETQ